MPLFGEVQVDSSNNSLLSNTVMHTSAVTFRSNLLLGGQRTTFARPEIYRVKPEGDIALRLHFKAHWLKQIHVSRVTVIQTTSIVLDPIGIAFDHLPTCLNPNLV